MTSGSLRLRLGLAGLLLLAACGGLAAAGPAASPAAPAATAAQPGVKYAYGHVYLLRGLGNFMSRGLDTFYSEFSGLGVPVSIYNHTLWQDVASQIIAEYRTNKNLAPIIIIGHSLGANAAILMSNWLGENGVPVRLVVCFDNVISEMSPIENNVPEVISYFKPPFGRGVKPAADFKGKLTNNDLAARTDLDHIKIDKDPVIHQAVIDKVLAILKKKPATVVKG